MACRWVKDSEFPGGKFHLPDCMGGAVYGPTGCTCLVKQRRKDLEDKIDALERRLAKLEKRILGQHGT